MPDKTNTEKTQGAGFPDKKTPTDDKLITVITINGDFRGMINLNSAPVKVDRVSDFLSKTDLSFLPLYNTTVMGSPGETIFLNFTDIAVVIQPDEIDSKRAELRRDTKVNVKLKNNLGQINGKVNFNGENRPVDRVSDLLNYPEKKWLVVYEASFKGKAMLSTIINMNFISMVRVAN